MGNHGRLEAFEQLGARLLAALCRCLAVGEHAFDALVIFLEQRYCIHGLTVWIGA